MEQGKAFKAGDLVIPIGTTHTKPAYTLSASMPGLVGKEGVVEYTTYNKITVRHAGERQSWFWHALDLVHAYDENDI